MLELSSIFDSVSNHFSNTYMRVGELTSSRRRILKSEATRTTRQLAKNI